MVDELRTRPTEAEMDAFMAQQFGTDNATDNTTPEQVDIFRRLASVQHALHAPKNQKNTFGNYNYRSCEDILEAVKPLLAEQGLTLTISDTLQAIGDRYYVKATAVIYDATGQHSVSAYAREEETKKGMDASQITGSASSYARKYALNGLFLIDDTKDADSNEQGRQREAAPAPERRPQQQQVQTHQQAQNVPQGQPQQATGASGNKRTDTQGKALWKISGANRDVLAGWCAEFGVSNDRDLTEEQAGQLITKYGEPR